MRNSARCLLVCSVLLLTGMRDPFRPPDDPCAIGELAQWRSGAFAAWWKGRRLSAFYRMGKSAGTG